MEKSNKEKILMALYAEYQKDKPMMEQNVKADRFDLEYKDFVFELSRLEKEGLIEDINFSYAAGIPSIAYYNNVKVTEKGKMCVEKESK